MAPISKYLVITIIACVTITVIAAMVDYINLFSSIGLVTSSFNMEFLALVVSNIMLVAVFLLTYFLIDSHGIDREGNKRITALIALRETYYSCNDMAKQFSDETIRTPAVQKCNFDIPAYLDDAMMHYYGVPFVNEGIIMGFAADGTLTPKEVEMYLRTKMQYKKINFVMIFHDNYAMVRTQENILLVHTNAALLEMAAELRDPERRAASWHRAQRPRSGPGDRWTLARFASSCCFVVFPPQRQALRKTTFLKGDV